jgi:hypothetical protein
MTGINPTGRAEDAARRRLMATPDTEVYIGKTDGEWPLEIFTAEDHAVMWLSEPAAPGSIKRRRLWRASISYVSELDLMPPVPARLRVKNDPRDAK